MLDIKTLLPELKKLVTDVSEDLLARSTAKNDPYSAKVDAGLREAYTQIEKGGRTADAFEVWREDYLDQVAVAWVLGCVFVRFMEDNHLIDERWLAGDGDRRKLAEDTHELYFRAHPHESDREYFEHVFHEVGKIPACRDLFAEGKTPLWAVGPSGDAAMKLLAYWRDVVPETGELQRSFEVEDGDTRFLGDLYQDLSERARKKYALLQTPVFVEEFILDRTLNPAIDEFGLDEVRMIDPTCGSGHFLLGGFARLFDLWIKREDNEVVAAQKAIDGVWGVDINPFAVAIARFRLIVAALRACGIERLKSAHAWNIHLATGDSLLFGSRWDREGRRKGEQQFLSTDEESWTPEIYACEDKAALSEVLGQQYHAVVGNPPYITVKDKSLNQAYRDRYPKTCYRQYSLACPFAERFFDLGTSGSIARTGWVGMITANSFMKREFGKNLIQDFLPSVDLTDVVDTSGAYIPGHTTPTVILFGRNRSPQLSAVRAVMGIRGEPSTPADPSDGQVWQSILKHIDTPDCEDDFTSSADVPRGALSTHPWSLGGGGASVLKERLDGFSKVKLKDRVQEIGFSAVTREDDVFALGKEVAIRNGIRVQNIRPLVSGDEVRDWSVFEPMEGVFPYDPDSLNVSHNIGLEQFLWQWKTQLSIRVAYGNTQLERGLVWYEYSMLFRERLRSSALITFAAVATHNHFVLCRGGMTFKQSAPVIKLTDSSTEDDHLALLGLLNSSLCCFWMKQVFYPKASSVGDISTDKGRPEANRYDFAATGLLSFPIPESVHSGSLITGIARELDALAQETLRLLPRQILATSESPFEFDVLQAEFSQSERRYGLLRRRIVALQEELDWEVYREFGLTNHGASQVILSNDLVGVADSLRPFLWSDGDNQAELSDDIRQVYSERRKEIDNNRAVKFLETLVFKRPWWGRQGVYGLATRTYPEWIKEACEEWLLKRLESHVYWDRTAPTMFSVAELSGQASADREFLEVASLLRGRRDFDIASLVAALVEKESVPLLSVLRYKPAGLRKRTVWEEVWELQRKEDAGEKVGTVKVPPSYASTDFQKSDYWRLRGKLDVPKERWISFPHCETESDPSLVVGWAGWNHLQQATAIIAYYDARKREGWDAKRLTPLLAGLDQLLPWIHQWHPEVDPEFGETAGQSFETMLKADAHELGLTLEDIRAWEPPAKKKGGRRKAKG